MATCCLLLLLASARWRNMLRLGASAAVAHARMRCAALLALIQLYICSDVDVSGSSNDDAPFVIAQASLRHATQI